MLPRVAFAHLATPGARCYAIGMNAQKQHSGAWVPVVTVNHRLAIAREGAEIGVERMGQLMGVNRRTITRWERPGTRVPRSVVLGYHAATQADLGWIETGSAGPASYTPRDLNPEPTVSGLTDLLDYRLRRAALTPEQGGAA
jgi:DNA-binding XRE family transcriptional regulator